jgi:hypothetical protein
VDAGAQPTIKTTSQSSGLIIYGIRNMIRKLFLAAALLVPGLAYGANPSADLSVKVVPAGKAGICGVIMGQAATDAAAAGFNTCALYNDFTTAIPNSVGTGLPSNWLDCNLDGGTSAVWYWGFASFENSSNALPCTGHVAWNVTDPVYGNLALQFTLTDSDISTYSFPVSGMETVNLSANNPVPGPGQYPYGYYEWTFRNDNTSGLLNNAFWSWVTALAGQLANGSGCCVVELDFTETGPSGGDAAGNRWGSQGAKLATWYTARGVAGVSAYHTWGTLFTGDGDGNFSMCSYVDGVRTGCSHQTYDASGENLQRRFLQAWLQAGGSGFGTSHQYIESVKVLTCANWLQSSAAGMCNGSTLNGSGFYQ